MRPGFLPLGTALALSSLSVPLPHRAPPVVASSAVSKERARLNAIFSACAEGQSISSEDEAAIRAVGGRRSSRYGEITPRGFAKLAARLELGEDDVFADLGSGTGRACFQAVRDHGVRVSCGVELSLTRHEAAVQKRDALEAHEAERVRLVCADCAAAELWSHGGAMHDASVVWICSELYNDALMERIGACLEGSESVRAVATLRPFPGGLRGYRLEARPERCEMSWTAALTNPNAVGTEPDDESAGAAVHIYVHSALDGVGSSHSAVEKP